jgi:ribonuclease E
VEVVEEEAPAKRGRRRGGRKPRESVEPDSSPMVERPTDEEPPIAEVAPAEEAKPKRRRSKKAAEAEITVPEPAPAEAPPAETAEAAAEAPAKPVRKRKAKAKDEPAAAESEPPVPAPANSDTAEGGFDESGEPRRGWWQRTFG